MTDEPIAGRNREHRLQNLIAEHDTGGNPHYHEDSGMIQALDSKQRFVLVESDATFGNVWLSSHRTAKAAAYYHDNQEFAEGWVIVELVDLSTGARLHADTVTTFA